LLLLVDEHSPLPREEDIGMHLSGNTGGANIKGGTGRPVPVDKDFGSPILVAFFGGIENGFSGAA
jgi:hypothetical protein